MRHNQKLTADRRTIGWLAAESGCSVETIRFYERNALMAPPPRSPGGHRLYSDRYRERLRFIRRARDLGFPLSDVKALLAVADNKGGGCGSARAITTRHLAEVRAKIADLKRLERVLEKTIRLCHGGAAPDCAVIDALAAPDLH